MSRKGSCAHKGWRVGYSTAECAGPTEVRDFDQWAELMIAADPWNGHNRDTLGKYYAPTGGINPSAARTGG